MRLQTKFFLAALAAATLALAVAGIRFATSMRAETNARIEQTLVAEARLAAELLEQDVQQRPNAGGPRVQELDAEADRLGALVGARVTFIALDGQVVGDSAEPLDRLATMENHRARPEVVAAQATGLGRARRYSATLDIDMLYVAVPVRHSAIGIVRVALPLTDVRSQLRTVLTAILTALGLALLGGAVIAAIFARRIGRRVRAIASVADRYRRGDLAPARLDYGNDELGTVARTLDDTVQQLGRKLEELARDPHPVLYGSRESAVGGVTYSYEAYIPGRRC